jgi:hypothetical protein
MAMLIANAVMCHPRASATPVAKLKSWQWLIRRLVIDVIKHPKKNAAFAITWNVFLLKIRLFASIVILPQNRTVIFAAI